jgi:hypothetical protein
MTKKISDISKEIQGVRYTKLEEPRLEIFKTRSAENKIKMKENQGDQKQSIVSHFDCKGAKDLFRLKVSFNYIGCPNNIFCKLEKVSSKS